MTRKYTHHQQKSEREYISVHIGKVSDSYEALQTMCNDKSVKMLKTIELNKGEDKDVVFWTEDFPELIATSHFHKDENGNVMFTLDDSESTL